MSSTIYVKALHSQHKTFHSSTVKLYLNNGFITTAFHFHNGTIAKLLVFYSVTHLEIFGINLPVCWFRAFTSPTLLTTRPKAPFLTAPVLKVVLFSLLSSSFSAFNSSSLKIWKEPCNWFFRRAILASNESDKVFLCSCYCNITKPSFLFNFFRHLCAHGRKGTLFHGITNTTGNSRPFELCIVIRVTVSASTSSCLSMSVLRAMFCKNEVRLFKFSASGDSGLRFHTHLQQK